MPKYVAHPSHTSDLRYEERGSMNIFTYRKMTGMQVSLRGIFSHANRPLNDVISIAFGSIERCGVAAEVFDNIVDGEGSGRGGRGALLTDGCILFCCSFLNIIFCPGYRRWKDEVIPMKAFVSGSVMVSIATLRRGAAINECESRERQQEEECLIRCGQPCAIK